MATTVAGERIEARTEVTFDGAAGALRARAVRRLGRVRLSDTPLPVPDDAATAALFARAVVQGGLEALPWPEDVGRLRERVAFLRASDPEAWPDLGDDALAASAEAWLAPLLLGRTRLVEVAPDDLRRAIDDLVGWEARRRLDAEAPTHLDVPTGSRIPVDYAAEGGPAVSVRVQELFGLDRHPVLGRARVPVVLHLLSPAHRPIQTTRDLPGFWRGSWAEVRSAMRGRYPRHPWPENPAAAEPTRRAKPRGT